METVWYRLDPSDSAKKKNSRGPMDENKVCVSQPISDIATINDDMHLKTKLT